MRDFYFISRGSVRFGLLFCGSGSGVMCVGDDGG